MFGKVFSSLYPGSMFGAGCHIFAVWPYAIANADAKGYVELNPRLVAGILGGTVEEIQAAIEYLQQPDPDSRNPAEDGRRLAREGQYLYRIVSYAKYREMRNKEAKRDYDRKYQRTRYKKERENTVLANSRDISSQGEGEREEAEGETYLGLLEDDLSPSVLASAVLSECRIAGQHLRMTLEDVAQSHLNGGDTLLSLKDRMIKAFHDYQVAKPKLEFACNPEKFFGSGDWDKPQNWPWKEGQQPSPRSPENRYWQHSADEAAQ